MKKTTNKKKSPLYVGKEVYLGKMSIEEAFQKALEPYFKSELVITKKIS